MGRAEVRVGGVGKRQRKGEWGAVGKIGSKGGLLWVWQK